MEINCSSQPPENTTFSVHSAIVTLSLKVDNILKVIGKEKFFSLNLIVHTGNNS